MGFSKNDVFRLDSIINCPNESNPGANPCVSLADQNLISTAHLYYQQIKLAKMMVWMNMTHSDNDQIHGMKSNLLFNMSKQLMTKTATNAALQRNTWTQQNECPNVQISHRLISSWDHTECWKGIFTSILIDTSYATNRGRRSVRNIGFAWTILPPATNSALGLWAVGTESSTHATRHTLRHTRTGSYGNNLR